MIELDSKQFIAAVPQLIDQLCRRVESEYVMLDYTLESLKELDMWLRSLMRKLNIPGTDEQDFRTDELKCELSAYLGEVMRKITDGQWSVEQPYDDEEAAIRYGKRKSDIFIPDWKVIRTLFRTIECSSMEEGLGLSSEVWLWIFNHPRFWLRNRRLRSRQKAR